jgi:hypothetical protein
MTGADAQRAELVKVKDRADMLCSGHARLRDRYFTRATVLDTGIMVLTAWLSALVFVDPQINGTLTPFGLDPRLWTGFLSLGAFALSIVQLKTDWKGRADAHRRSLDTYAEVKREATRLAGQSSIEERAYAAVLERYNLASAIGIAMPEKEFLKQKRHHKMKVAVSRLLDTNPGAPVPILRARLWFRDTFKEIK